MCSVFRGRLCVSITYLCFCGLQCNSDWNGLDLRCIHCQTLNTEIRNPRCQQCDEELFRRTSPTAGEGAEEQTAGDQAAELSLDQGCDYAQGKLKVALAGARDGSGKFSPTSKFTLRCLWTSESETTVPLEWFVTKSFTEFHELHRDLKTQGFKRVAMDQGLTYPSFNSWRIRRMSNDISDREKKLTEYVQHMFKVLQQVPQLLHSPVMNNFLAESEGGTLQSIVEAHKEEHEAEDAEEELTMISDEVTQAEQAVMSLARRITRAQGDLRDDSDLQYVLSVCLGVEPKLSSLVLQFSHSQDEVEAELGTRASHCKEQLGKCVVQYKRRTRMRSREAYEQVQRSFHKSLETGRFIASKK